MTRHRVAAAAWLLAGLLAAAPSTAATTPGATANGKLTFVWRDRFSSAEQDKLTRWVEETYAAVEQLVGEFPMGVRIYLHRRDDSREPVPWAHTQRRQDQGVHFHVDPAFPLESFRDDWTAPHELSHLILPYVGRRQAWFSEGFASYMQYQVMQAMGVLSNADADARYRRNLGRAAGGYRYPDEPFVEAAPKIYAARQYPVMYWGGAAYFMQVETSLRNADSSLLEVLREYVACCRRNRASLDALLTELDAIAPGEPFRARYAALASEPGFPDF